MVTVELGQLATHAEQPALVHLGVAAPEPIREVEEVRRHARSLARRRAGCLPTGIATCFTLAVTTPATSDDPAPGTALARSQAARRRRVLDAALRLAERGGFDAVQMRDVATEANVALGTVYRYFSVFSSPGFSGSAHTSSFRLFTEYAPSSRSVSLGSPTASTSSPENRRRTTSWIVSLRWLLIASSPVTATRRYR